LNNFKDVNKALIDFEKKELVVNSKKTNNIINFSENSASKVHDYYQGN
jgi:hypothetical protein